MDAPSDAKRIGGQIIASDAARVFAGGGEWGGF